MHVPDCAILPSLPKGTRDYAACIGDLRSWHADCGLRGMSNFIFQGQGWTMTMTMDMPIIRTTEESSQHQRVAETMTTIRQRQLNLARQGRMDESARYARLAQIVRRAPHLVDSVQRRLADVNDPF